MRRRPVLLALAWLPCVLMLALWGRSYWRCDYANRQVADGYVHAWRSERGGVYLMRVRGAVAEPLGSGTARRGGDSIERETGTARRRWVPIYAWARGAGERSMVVPHWVPTLARPSRRSG